MACSPSLQPHPPAGDSSRRAGSSVRCAAILAFVVLASHGCSYDFDAPFASAPQATPVADGSTDGVADAPSDLSLDQGDGLGPDGGPDGESDSGLDGPADSLQPDAADGADSDASTLGQACTIPGYEGWSCLGLTQSSALHGVDFHLEIRWNLPEDSPASTSLWLLGNNGSGRFRTDYHAQLVQDQLAAFDGIRSVEVEFTDPPDAADPAHTGGYFREPRQGYPDAARVYRDVVSQLMGLGIAQGQWLTHIGSSNGAMLGAVALARHDLGSAVKRYIFAGGPFASDLGAECREVSGYASMPSPGSGVPIRELIDLWNGWTANGTCLNHRLIASPSYDDRSPLGSTALRAYPDSSILFLLGENDEFGAWMQQSHETFFNELTAGKKSRYLIAGAPHDLFAGSDGAVRQTVLDLVYNHARLAPLEDTEPAARIVFSNSADGAPETDFNSFELVFGRVEGIGQSASGCMDDASSSGCAFLSAWDEMPNNDWHWDSGDGVWRASFGLMDFPDGEYMGWWRDSSSGQVTERARLTIH